MERRERVIESVKRTPDNSPAIHRWENSNHERISPRSGRLNFFEVFRAKDDFQSPVSRAWVKFRALPSTEVLGYCHASASRTEVIIIAPCPSNELLGYSHGVRFADCAWRLRRPCFVNNAG